VTPFRFISPERRWRAAFMALPAAFFGWRAFVAIGPVAGYLVGGGLIILAVPIMRTCLIVTDEDLQDRRAIRRIRIPWSQVVEFQVERPGWLWGGFCVIAVCRNGTQIDLLSTRAYTRAPSERHLDELHRLCWTLTELLATRDQNPPS
jgi:hypothetical protein